MVTIGSLCSGYGGLDMGLQTVIGGEVRWHFEYDKHASQILKHHHPSIPNYGDITTTDWDIEPVDWLTAGYPCQPFSTAGQRKGTNDARHIWPYIKSAIRTLQPRNVLLENVAGHLSLGFGTVLGDLAKIGYDTKWICIRAADAGAPHTRRRLFIVANTQSHKQQQQAKPGVWPQLGDSFTTTADPDGDRSQTRDSQSGGTSAQGHGRTWPGFGPYSLAVERWERILGRPAPTPIDGNDRITTAFVEWMMGLAEGHVTNVQIPWTAQMKALGNGVVPQQAALALQVMGVQND